MHMFALLFRYLLWMESRCLYKIILLSLEFGFLSFEIESLGNRVMWSRWVRHVTLSHAAALTPAAAAATSPRLRIILSIKMIVNLVWFKLRGLLTRHDTTKSVFGFFTNTYNWQICIRRFTVWKQKKSATKFYLQVALNLGRLPFQFDAYQAELTWRVLVRGSLNCLLFMHYLILGFRWYSWAKRAWLHKWHTSNYLVSSVG